jgi:DNA-binding transcriptional ArsR family regulator
VVNQPAVVDDILHALADPTRRVIIEQLGQGAASVSDLATPLPMSMPAVMQHLKVLEDVGLVRSEKVGRVRTCHLEVAMLTTVQDWIAERKRTWESRLDRLGALLAAESAANPESPSDSDVPSKANPNPERQS